MKFHLGTEKPVALTPAELWISVAASLVVGVVLASQFGLLGLCSGFLTVAGTSGLVIVLVEWLTMPPLPADARICAEAARRRFQEDCPNVRIVGTAVRDTTEERFIISIHYAGGRPTPRMYYAVTRSDQTVSAEDTWTWWPRGLK